MPEAPLRDLTQEEINTCWTDGAVCARHSMPRSWIESVLLPVHLGNSCRARLKASLMMRICSST